MREERRVRRSDELYEALVLQLSACASRARLRALVLVEGQGIPVARLGEITEEIEEIASISPSLAPSGRPWRGKIRTAEGGSRVVTIVRVRSDDGDLFLCAVGGLADVTTPELFLGSRGVRRILS